MAPRIPYQAPDPTQPYMGEYSRLAAQLAARRHNPVQSVGQGIADVLGDVGEAYFAKKAMEKEKKQQIADNSSIAKAIMFASQPRNTMETQRAMGQTPQPNMQWDEYAFPQANQGQVQAAAMAKVSPNMQLEALPFVQQAAQSAQPKPTQYMDVSNVGLVGIPDPRTGGKPKVAIGVPEKQPEVSPLARMIAERDALPEGDQRRAIYDAKIANETRAPADPNANKVPSQENTFRDEFTRAVTPYVAVRDANEKVKAGVKADSAAGDMATIFAFMKILDPGSTVREGEYASAEQARGVPETIMNLYNKTIRGEKLTPDQRKDFSARAQDIVNSQRPLFEATKTRYVDMAKRGNLNPQNVVFDFDLPPPAAKDLAELSDDEYAKMSNEELMAAYAARKKK